MFHSIVHVKVVVTLSIRSDYGNKNPNLSMGIAQVLQFKPLLRYLKPTGQPSILVPTPHTVKTQGIMHTIKDLVK